ncbi:MAG TPA: acetolactate synthase small subunit [Armatimonadota bacterium]|nr:acetolactate synthase small subunit [Armatimonadota bacterium]
MRHTLSVLVENQPGVLSRVAGLFSRRGFNIESLAVKFTEDITVSRMTIVVEGDERALEQISKQLHKLIEVIKVFDYTNAPVVERELALIKINADQSVRGAIMQIADIFRAKIVDVSERSFIMEVTGDVGKVDALEGLLRPFGIIEVVRTGKIVLQRGGRA